MYKEGKAVIKYRKDTFLNPDGLLSRDLSVAFVAALSNKKTKILDSTAATGIRGIRYYLETPSKNITLLDMNKTAFSSAKKNLAFNKVKSRLLGTSIQEFANTTKDKFEIIDLDPFGGATPYIYDLMKISHDGTCLLITVTDSAVLCGADFKACVRLYDARPMHNELCQEVGLRLLIGYVARIAAQFNFGIEVLFSFSYLHYMRIFVRLEHGSQKAIGSIKKLGYVHYCNKCLYRGSETSSLPTRNKCRLCNGPLETAGKVWLGKLYDKDVVESLKRQMSRNPSSYDQKSLKFLEAISKEADIPLYYSIPRITKKLKIGSVSTDLIIGMLEKRGFAASKTHLSNYAIKTDANIKIMKSCIRAVSEGY